MLTCSRALIYLRDLRAAQPSMPWLHFEFTLLVKSSPALLALQSAITMTGTKCKADQPTCVKTWSCSMTCSRTLANASGMFLWLSEGKSLVSSSFFFIIVAEHFGDIREGFKKYPQISSPFSGGVLPLVSAVFNTEKWSELYFSTSKWYNLTNILVL